MSTSTIISGQHVDISVGDGAYVIAKLRDLSEAGASVDMGLSAQGTRLLTAETTLNAVVETQDEQNALLEQIGEVANKVVVATGGIDAGTTSSLYVVTTGRDVQLHPGLTISFTTGAARNDAGARLDVDGTGPKDIYVGGDQPVRANDFPPFTRVTVQWPGGTSTSPWYVVGAGVVPGAVEGVATAETRRTLSYASRSPFQPAATFAAGLPEAAARAGIIDVDLSGETYDPAKLYALAVVIKVDAEIQIQLHSQTTPTGPTTQVRVFSMGLADGYDPISQDILRIENAAGSIAFVPAKIPNGFHVGMTWATHGLADHVFRAGFGAVAQVGGDRPAVLDRATRALTNGFVPNYAYLHPNEPAEHEGDSSFDNPDGKAQWHVFTAGGGVVQQIGTALYNKPGDVFKGTVRVVTLPSLGSIQPESGTLVQQFSYAAGTYGDLTLDLDQPVYFPPGTILVAYATADPGYKFSMRRWDHPRTGQPNPHGRRALIYRTSPTGPWAFGTETADYAFYQPPLRLRTNNVSRAEITTIVADAIAAVPAPRATPRLVLPSKVHAVVGLECNLYYDAMCLMPEIGLGQIDLLFDFKCDIGEQGTRRWHVTPSAGQVGSHLLRIRIYSNRGELLEEKTTMIVVVAAVAPATLKRVLEIADSTKDDTAHATKTTQSNLAAMGGVTPVFIGTHGVAPYNMEARSGQDIGYFADGGVRYKFTVTGFPDVPFWPWWNIQGVDGSGFILGYEEASIVGGSGTFIAAIGANPNGQTIGNGWTGQLKLGGVTFDVTNTQVLPKYSIFRANGTGNLDIGDYITRFGFVGCDALTIDLGPNGCRDAVQTDERQMLKINDFKTLCTAFLNYNANVRIIVCLPKSCSSIRNNNVDNDSYRINIHRLRELLIEHFDDGAFHPNVTICASGLMIDRYYGYPLAQQPVAARFTETETINFDYVHPVARGYEQVADAVTATVLAVLAA